MHSPYQLHLQNELKNDKTQCMYMYVHVNVCVNVSVYT